MLGFNTNVSRLLSPTHSHSHLTIALALTHSPAEAKTKDTVATRSLVLMLIEMLENGGATT